MVWKYSNNEFNNILDNILGLVVQTLNSFSQQLGQS